MGTVFRRAAARRDLIQHYAYLAEVAGEVRADRFLECAAASFQDLADHPKIGSPVVSRHPALSGIRKWRVRDYDNYLIFYLPRRDGVSIVRVLYTAMDWWRLLWIDEA